MKKLFIKNMVCDRCISSVKRVLESQDLAFTALRLGEVELQSEIGMEDLTVLGTMLKDEGFDLINSTSSVIVNQVKSALIELFRAGDIPEDFKLSTYLAGKLPYDYSHISRVFSQKEQNTIEHYLINLRIEKAKELLAYNTLNISEVAYRLGYVSSAHFSRQFKSITGVTPSQYMNNPTGRKSLEEI